MGQVSNATPTLLTNVKTALGSGFSKLTDFRNTGAAGVANTAGVNGFLPTSGVIKLTDLRDATKANCRGNIVISVSGTQYSNGSASCRPTANLLANGSLEIQYNINAIDEQATGGSNAEGFFNREWLLLNASPVLQGTANNWEIKVTKFGGTCTSLSFSNNTWVISPLKVEVFVSKSGGTGQASTSLQCNLEIRRADTLTVVHSGKIFLSATAVSEPGPPP